MIIYILFVKKLTIITGKLGLQFSEPKKVRAACDTYVETVGTMNFNLVFRML